MFTYYGYVQTYEDAIKLFEACRQGKLPLLQRRLLRQERALIQPGCVFVWDEQETGMKIWSDGKVWNTFQESDRFRIYEEMIDHGKGTNNSDRYSYKPNGLLKKVLNIATSTGKRLHLVSYSLSHSNPLGLSRPTTDPGLQHIIPVKEIYSTKLPKTQTRKTAPAQRNSCVPLPSLQPVPAEYQYRVSSDYQWRPPPSQNQAIPLAYESVIRTAIRGIQRPVALYFT
ncbi:Gti1/Pac2 family-domain-containing protein [Xylogone sp. PMI_703]|nr:Gti1/Pac2 family-domain-containing protein [Xylogone sp. PMI_703]